MIEFSLNYGNLIYLQRINLKNKNLVNLTAKTIILIKNATT